MPKKVAVLVEDGYEDLELWYPYYRLVEEGYNVTLVGSEYDNVYKSKHGYPAKSEMCRFDGSKQKWDAVVVPGGSAPDILRRYPEIIDIVRRTYNDGGIVAAICHGPSVLVSADIVRDRNVTSFFSIKDDLVHAGGKWNDSSVVADGNLITSRTPADLPDFMKAVTAGLGS